MSFPDLFGINPMSAATSSKNALSDWKKPYFLSAISLVGFLGKLSFGYFIKAPSVANEIRKPPSIPRRSAVKTENPLALPSKSIKSCHCLGVSWSLYCCPFPIEKYSPMAFSPEWPKGGFPMSCANEAAATIAPKSFM